MSRNEIRMRLNPDGTNSVIINGIEMAELICAGGVTLDWLDRQRPLVTIDLLPTAIAMDGHADVVIHPTTAALLEALGWTPPGHEDDPDAPTDKQLQVVIEWIEVAMGPLADWQRDSIEHTLTEAIQGHRSYPPVYRTNLGLVEFPVPTHPNCTEWTYVEIRDLAAFRAFQIPSIQRPLTIDASDNATTEETQ